MDQIPAAGIGEEPAFEKSGVDCEGFMATIAHNVMKAVRRLGQGAGPPEDFRIGEVLTDRTSRLVSGETILPAVG